MIITMTKKILWFDIETAPEVNGSDFSSYPKKRLWENKMIEKGITTTFERSYMEKASIYPEFAKVVCISYLVDNQVKSLIGQDEAMLLKLQFLEGKKRKKFFKKHPPKIVYVHSERIMCAKNWDFEWLKKSWWSAVAYAWYIWENGWKWDPVIRRI